MFIRSLAASAAVVVVAAAPASAEVLLFQPATLSAEPGSTVRALVLLRESSVPLRGYSLEVRGSSAPDQGGGRGVLPPVRVDTAQTNFFDPRNLITAGGLVRDGVLSVISPRPFGGVFVSAVTTTGTITATAGVNDVLAEIVFRIAPDSPLGTTEFDFGTLTALGDANGSAVPFTSTGVSVTVIPGPAALALLGLAGVAAARRRREAGV
jgi:hypothetical protein